MIQRRDCRVRRTSSHLSCSHSRCILRRLSTFWGIRRSREFPSAYMRLTWPIQVYQSAFSMSARTSKSGASSFAKEIIMPGVLSKRARMRLGMSLTRRRHRICSTQNFSEYSAKENLQLHFVPQRPHAHAICIALRLCQTFYRAFHNTSYQVIFPGYIRNTYSQRSCSQRRKTAWHQSLLLARSWQLRERTSPQILAILAYSFTSSAGLFTKTRNNLNVSWMGIL